MVTSQTSRRPRTPRSSSASTVREAVWPAYLGITAILVLIVVALAGGIIWYNLRKSTDLMVGAAERQMIERDAMISDRIRLLYDPLYAIVGIASQVPEMKAPINENGHVGMPMLLRTLRFYPQIFSLFVGFENGDFFSVAHAAGQSRSRFRSFLGAPENAAFSNRIITRRSDGMPVERWVFIDDDGIEVGQRDPVPTSFDPRARPWYAPALRSDHVELSDLFVFAANNEPGFTLSRAFRAAMPGVFGASLAATDLSDFLNKQRITESSLCFIFTRAGEIVAYPDEVRMAAIVPQGGDIMVALPQLSELKDPVATGLFAAYRESGASGNFVYPVADRSYIGRVIEIPVRYGRDQLLGIAVPIDEIQQPAIALRNQTLFYSVAFLVFALPIYLTLIVFWIDRRLGRRTAPFRPVDDD
jgi:adenylate cyclase